MARRLPLFDTVCVKLIEHRRGKCHDGENHWVSLFEENEKLLNLVWYLFSRAQRQMQLEMVKCFINSGKKCRFRSLFGNKRLIALCTTAKERMNRYLRLNPRPVLFCSPHWIQAQLTLRPSPILTTGTIVPFNSLTTESQSHRAELGLDALSKIANPSDPKSSTPDAKSNVLCLTVKMLHLNYSKAEIEQAFN